MTSNFGNVFVCGFSGLPEVQDELDFGDGLLLRSTFAHLMFPSLMAFKKAPPDAAHPPPWKAVHGSRGIDITAELVISSDLEVAVKQELGTLLAMLFRLWVSPYVMLTAFANASFSALSEMKEDEGIIFTGDTGHRRLRFGKTENNIVHGELSWVQKNWKKAYELSKRYESLAFALDSLDSINYAHRSGAALLSLWGAIEALFATSRAELRFRISVNIATFLEPPGIKRLELQKQIAKLYDARSSVAHGSNEIDLDAIGKSYDVLRRSIIKIIEFEKFPSGEGLTAELLNPNHEKKHETAASK